MTGRTLILKRAIAAIGIAGVVSVSVSACSQQQFGIKPSNEEFGQRVTYNTEVEVLWVIDTSGSMARHQSLLAEQVAPFLSALNETKLSYQIGVTTMDFGNGGAKGRFLYQEGTPGILTNDSPDLVPLLKGRLQPGETGSIAERGQEAMRAALELAKGTGNSNSGFLRPNSLLVVIFLTNEEDESVNADYAAFLDQVRPPLPTGERSWIAHFMGVTPTDPSCKTAEWNHKEPGYRYMALANASGGVSESICDADLRRALTNVRSRILEIMTEFRLDKKPLLSSIQVYVDGVLVPENETNGWTYYEQSNSIRFHGAGVPKPGSTIKVNFDPATLD